MFGVEGMSPNRSFRSTQARVKGLYLSPDSEVVAVSGPRYVPVNSTLKAALLVKADAIDADVSATAETTPGANPAG